MTLSNQMSLMIAARLADRVAQSNSKRRDEMDELYRISGALAAIVATARIRGLNGLPDLLAAPKEDRVLRQSGELADALFLQVLAICQAVDRRKGGGK